MATKLVVRIKIQFSQKAGMDVPDDIRESAAIANVKTVAEQSIILSNFSLSNVISNDNLSQQNAASFQQSMNQLTTIAIAKGVNKVSNINPLESISVTEVRPVAPSK